MVDGTSEKISIAQSLGLDGKLVALCLCTVLAAAVVYSAWLLGADRTLVETLNRFSDALGAMLGFAILGSPVIIPCMVVGWSLGWIIGGLVRLPFRARTLIAAGVLGGSAVLPFLFFFGSSGYAAEILVRPLLCIVPISAILIAAVIYRKR